MNSVTVRFTKVYGVQKCYPVCDRSHAFARIAGTKTLSADNLNEIRLLGFDVVQQADTSVERFMGNSIAFCPRCRDGVPTIDNGETCFRCRLVL